MTVDNSQPQLLFVVAPGADTVLVDSMVGQLIENGIFFEFDAVQNLPEKLPDDFERYRAILLDTRVLREAQNDKDLVRRLEAYASGTGYIFTFSPGQDDEEVNRLEIRSTMMASRSANIKHATDLEVMLGCTDLRRRHPGFIRRQHERPDEQIIAELKATLVHDLEHPYGWGEFTMVYWKAAMFLCGYREHEDLREPLIESIRRVAKEPCNGWEAQSVGTFFGPAWLYEQTGETEPLNKIRPILDMVIARRPRTMGVLTHAGFVDDPLGLRSDGAGWTCSTARSLVWPELLHRYGGTLFAMTRVTGEKHYRDEAMKLVRHLATYHIEEDNLVNHGTLEGVRISHKWGRAQAHMLYGLLYVLDEMKPDDPEAEELIGLIRRVGNGLKPYQDAETGLWRNLVDHPHARLESTSTACFTYVFGRGIRDGWLDADEFGQMVRRGREGLKMCYWRGGFAANCRGTRVGTSKQYYLSRPQGWSILPHGLMAMVVSLGNGEKEQE
jgi:hypothetical protein